MMTSSQAPTHVRVDNRILAEVNGKAITVLDLQKKMEMVLRQAFAQHADNPVAQFQFYNGSWRQVLDELIDRELVLADAQRMGMKVTTGEIRQEMVQTFGHDVMGTLDQLEMPYNEAWELVESEMLIRRMTFARAHMKAFTKVHPSDVRSAYQDYLNDFDDSPQLTYRVVTIRSDDEERGREVADSVNQQLESSNDLATAVAVIVQQSENDPTVSTKLSDLYVQKGSEISPDYLEVLAALSPGNASTPTAQYSKATGKTVYRLFLLEDSVSDPAQPFEDLEELFNNRLVERSIAEETLNYKQELRTQFNMTEERLCEMIPPGFSPFTLN
jgi:hypothetical protein